MSEPSPVNEGVLKQRFKELESARSWSPHVLAEFERFIRSAGDYDLFRVNPIQYAGANGLSEADGIELFLEADRLDTEQLLKKLKAKLPYYMVPRRIRVLQRLPLNPNGKFDRKSLETILAKH